MSKECKKVEIMLFLCKDEIASLISGLSSFQKNSENVLCLLSSRNRLKGDEITSSFKMNAFDLLNTQLSDVLNQARKFNTYLRLNNPNNITMDVSKTLSGKLCVDVDRSGDGTSYETFKTTDNLHQLVELTNQIHQDPLVSSRSVMNQHYSNLRTLLTVTASTQAIVDKQTATDFNGRHIQNVDGTSIPKNSQKALTASVPAPAAKRTTASSDNEQLDDSQKEEDTRSLKKLKPLLPECVNLPYIGLYREGHMFNACITYIENLTQLTFYICQMNNMDIIRMSTLHDTLAVIKRPLPRNEVFGVSNQAGGRILRAAVPKNHKFDAHIVLIDFGETTAVDEDNIFYNLPHKYRHIPAQAIRCKLEGLNEPGKLDKLEVLAQVLQKYEFKETKFCVMKRNGHLLTLRLFENQVGQQWEQLIDEQEADALTADPYDETQSNCYKNLEQHLPDQLKHVPEELFKKIKNMSLTPTSSVSNRDIEIIVRPSTLKANAVVNVIVTCVTTPNQFYAQINSYEGYSRHSLAWSETELTLTQKSIHPPSIGDLVLAQSLDDTFYYRAEVLCYHSERQLFEVCFVDHGNVEMVPLSCLAKCTCNGKQEPYRAISCIIAGVTIPIEVDKRRIHEVAGDLESLILYQVCKIRIIETQGVDLVIEFLDKQFENIAYNITANLLSTKET